MRVGRRVWPLVLLAICPAPAFAAQSADPAALVRLEAEVEAGRAEGVAEAVGRWIAEARNPTRESLARARYLRARLMADADSARTALLALALDGGSSFGALAWLRLAQLDLALGAPARASADLDRLRADYPRSPLATVSWHWTARTLEARGLLARACEAWQRAVTEARRVGDATSARLAAVASTGCGAGTPRFTVQVAALSRAETAREMRSRLEVDGFPARVVEDDALHRVRVGRFASPEAARGLQRRLHDAGYAADIVPEAT
ncbi:SPOR domain-containing protein [Candidatus Palauibacter sp.]|uniref:SPOR domain-containing protein n=1 Tax=Candidatus Palauibacter sp. TaxID=3101350 RepID=UPI003AF2D356